MLLLNEQLICNFLFLIIVIFIIAKNHFDKQLIMIQNSPIKLQPLPALFCYFFLILGLYFYIKK